ncbi:hypothetical protein KM043_014778 [Ampulex compressa]|nr:hypothetical protein KM043_014778 [Ampulex compressa]
MVKRLHEEVHLNEHPSSDVLSKLRQTAPTYFTKVKPKHYTLPCRIWEDMDMNHHIKYRTLAFISFPGSPRAQNMHLVLIITIMKTTMIMAVMSIINVNCIKCADNDV